MIHCLQGQRSIEDPGHKIVSKRLASGTHAPILIKWFALASVLMLVTTAFFISAPFEVEAATGNALSINVSLFSEYYTK